MDDISDAGAEAAALAWAAAEALRGLSHATLRPSGLGQPSAAYDVIGALSQAAAGAGQALAQITRYLDHALADGKLGHDLGEDPAPAVDAAAAFLDDACRSAAALAGDLGAAQQQLAIINGRPRSPKDQP